MTEDEQKAYDMGQRDGSIQSVEGAAVRAHTRLDKHGIRLTALERVMYAGMGIWFLIQVAPQIKAWVGD